MGIVYNCVLVLLATAIFAPCDAARRPPSRCYKCVVDYRRISSVFDAKFRIVTQNLQDDYWRKLNDTKEELIETFLDFETASETIPEYTLGRLDTDAIDPVVDESRLQEAEDEITTLKDSLIALRFEFAEMSENFNNYKTTTDQALSEWKEQTMGAKQQIAQLITQSSEQNTNLRESIDSLPSMESFGNLIIEVGSIVERIQSLETENESLKLANDAMEEKIEELSSTTPNDDEAANEDLQSLKQSTELEFGILRDQIATLQENSDADDLNEEGEEFYALKRDVAAMNETVRSLQANAINMMEEIEAIAEQSITAAANVTVAVSAEEVVNDVVVETAPAAVPAELQKKIDVMTRNITELQENLHNMKRGVDVSLKVRLAGGSANAGRVEIFYKNQWGTICDDYWDRMDANVVCRMLGFKMATSALTEGAYGAGVGQIWLDDLECDGDETTLWECSGRAWGSHNCGHDEDASVVCV